MPDGPGLEQTTPRIQWQAGPCSWTAVCSRPGQGHTGSVAGRSAPPIQKGEWPSHPVSPHL